MTSNDTSSGAGPDVGHDTEREEPPPSFPVPQRAPLPRPMRINRNALTIVAVAMGTLVLAAVVFVQPGRQNGPPPPVVPAPTAAEPTFLDRPTRPSLRGADPGAPPFDSTRQHVATSAEHGTDGPGMATTSGGMAIGATPMPSVTAGSGDVSRSWDVPVRLPPARNEDPEVVAYRAAMAAPLRPPVSAAVETPNAIPLAASIDGVTAALSQLGGDLLGGGSAAGDRRWGRQRSFLQDVDARDVAQTTRAALTPAPGLYAIQAGAMIPAVLLTEINSDLPGDVLAQVAHDVFDSRSQATLLIPKGARLLGTYDSEIASNQRRLFVAWTRLIFPDGRSLTLPGLETKDRSGAGGMADRVESHRRRTFAMAALLSLVGSGAQLAQPYGGYGVSGAAPSVGQVAAGAAGQQLSQVATEMLRKQMDVVPTIRIRQGMPFDIFVRSDFAFAEPYRPEPAR